jgi:hypothetical protein
LLIFLNYGKMSKGGIRSGALDAIISCGLISRSYLSNCLLVLLYNPNLFPVFDDGIGGLPTTIFADREASTNSSTDSQKVLLVFGLLITAVLDGGKPDTSRFELY